MHRHVTTLIALSLLAGCHRASDEDLTARIAALEARYHTQSRQIEELQAQVATLQAAAPTTVIDLVAEPKPQ